MLDASELNLAILEGQVGFASGVSEDFADPEMINIPAEYHDLCSTCRGMGLVDPEMSAKNDHSNDHSEGMVALHEAIHLTKVIVEGKGTYADPERRGAKECQPFQAEIGVGAALGRKIDLGVAAECK